MASQVNCYDPAHLLQKPGAGYAPCFNNTSDGYSLCCKDGWTCEDNLLCVFTGTDSSTTPKGAYARGLCTDKSFTSPNCPQFCLGYDQEIKNCGNSTGCCGDYTSDCSCSVGQPGALIFDVDHVWPNTVGATLSSHDLAQSTTNPTSPAQPSRSTAPANSAATNTNTGSVSNASNANSNSPPGSNPTLPNAGAPSTTIPAFQATKTLSPSSPSPTASISISSSPSDLGLKIGIPVSLIILIAGITIATILYLRRRRHRRKSRPPQPISKDPHPYSYQLPAEPASREGLGIYKHEYQRPMPQYPETRYHPLGKDGDNGDGGYEKLARANEWRTNHHATDAVGVGLMQKRQVSEVDGGYQPAELNGHEDRQVILDEDRLERVDPRFELG